MYGPMNKFGHMLLSVLLVAFVSASAPSAAQAAGVVVTALLVDGGSMGADCSDCAMDMDSAVSPCDMVCSPPSVAILNAMQGFLPSVVAFRRTEHSYSLLGRIGPPDSHPPQPTILS